MKKLETVNLKDVFIDPNRPLYLTKYKVVIHRTDKTKHLPYFENSCDEDSFELTKTMLTSNDILPYLIIEKEYNKLIPGSYVYKIIEKPYQCSPDVLSKLKYDYQGHYVTYYNDHDNYSIQ